MVRRGQKIAALNITEQDIKYAMMNSKSNKGAARFLGVSYPTYKKYAKQYFDNESGESLFELHKNQSGFNISKGSVLKHGYYRLNDILSGYHPDYDHKRLKERLIKYSIFEEKCARCSFSERRIIDYSCPLMLDWIDGDITNHKKENLQFLCYNCYYLTVNNIAGRKLKLDIF